MNICFADINSVDEIYSDLRRQGIACECLHGDRDQLERERALRHLRKGTSRLLIATDVAARGLDVADVTLVCTFSSY